MPEVPDRLVPTDGLCNYTVNLQSIIRSDFGAEFWFEVTELVDGRSAMRGRLCVDIRKSTDGLTGMEKRAYQQLRLVLRQILHVTDVFAEAGHET